MSELRLYCDLLLQQVNKIKENDELGDTAEVRLRFSWAAEIREAAVFVKLQYRVYLLQPVISVYICSLVYLTINKSYLIFFYLLFF